MFSIKQVWKYIPFISSFRKGSFHTKKNKKLLARGPLLSILGLSTQNKYQIYRRREQESILHLIPSLQTKRRSISPLHLFILFLLQNSIEWKGCSRYSGSFISLGTGQDVASKIINHPKLACSYTVQRLSTPPSDQENHTGPRRDITLHKIR